jgi:predicted enzyme related to lactoylglutathione lyase
MAKVNGHAAGTPTWFDVTTSDFTKARAFYGGLFHWTFEVGPPESGGYTMCLLDGEPVAGMGAPMPGSPMPPAWMVYFSTDDADASATAIREYGGSVVMGPMDVMEEGRLLVASDPTGAVFGLWQPKRHQGSRRVDEHGAMAWCEVATRQATRARDFYTRTLSLESKRLDGGPDASFEYYVLSRDAKDHAGVMQMDAKWPEAVPAHWMAYFAVDDTDATCARATSLGGKVCVPAFDTPYGRIAVLEDPTGATFSVIRLAAR